MSEANVKFLRLDREPCAPDENPCRFSFRCVVRNRGRHPKLEEVECGELLIAEATDIKRDPQGQNGGSPQWNWDGNREAPTFSPSINCEKHCGWHGYIRGGRCVTAQGEDEA